MKNFKNEYERVIGRKSHKLLSTRSTTGRSDVFQNQKIKT